MKPSELLNQANAVLDNGVRTREAYLTAVPMCRSGDGGGGSSYPQPERFAPSG